MGKPIIIVGAGGHAKVLMDCLYLNGAEIIGALDKSLSKNSDLGIPILGDDDAITAYPPDTVELINGIGSVGDTKFRAKLFRKFKKLGYTFSSVVHPSAVLSKSCILSEGVQVMAGAVINTGTRVGADSIINTGAIVDHECIIGSHVHIAPGCTLSGGVQVGDGAHIGTGATIIQGIKIGEHALIGAGAVVVKDVPAGAKVVGIPARII